LHFIFALEYDIRKVQENQEELNLMEHVSSWSMLSVVIHWMKANIIKKSAEALVEATREFGLEVNTE
jgi:hypothetical protein